MSSWTPAEINMQSGGGEIPKDPQEAHKPPQGSLERASREDQQKGMGASNYVEAHLEIGIACW